MSLISKRSNFKVMPQVQFLLLTLVATISCINASFNYRHNKALVIRRIELPYEQLSNNVEPIEYHLNLSLLRGFSSIKGKASIIVKFAGVAPTYFGHQISEAISNCYKKTKTKDPEEDAFDHIELHMDAGLDIEKVTLRVSRSIRTLYKGRGDRIEVEEVLRDHEKQLISIRLNRELPAGYLGKLSITYKSAPSRPFGHQTENDDDEDEELVRERPIELSLPAGNTRRLFPCFDEPKFLTKMRVFTYMPDMDGVVVSNLHRVKDQLHIMVKSGESFTKTEFTQVKPIAVDKLSFAIVRSDPTV